ncbi:acylphosphatase [Sphingomonas sp.]|uniref:acylphosphatase n=1 Tax=Sphingomonas sp. TaxID=28214 RepID=UPI002FC71897
MTTAKRLIVSGRVQGVFYRQWTVNEARALGLAGWVRNLRSGEVELLASGPEEAVRELIRRCREGPPAAVVEAVRVEDAEIETGAGFEARPTV